MIIAVKLTNKDFKQIAAFFKSHPTRRVCYFGIDKEGTVLKIPRSDPKVKNEVKGSIWEM